MSKSRSNSQSQSSLFQEISQEAAERALRERRTTTVVEEAFKTPARTRARSNPSPNRSEKFAGKRTTFVRDVLAESLKEFNNYLKKFSEARETLRKWNDLKRDDKVPVFIKIKVAPQFAEDNDKKKEKAAESTRIKAERELFAQVFNDKNALVDKYHEKYEDVDQIWKDVSERLAKFLPDGNKHPDLREELAEAFTDFKRQVADRLYVHNKEEAAKEEANKKRSAANALKKEKADTMTSQEFIRQEVARQLKQAGTPPKNQPSAKPQNSGSISAPKNKPANDNNKRGKRGGRGRGRAKRGPSSSSKPQQPKNDDTRNAQKEKAPATPTSNRGRPSARGRGRGRGRRN